MTQLTEERTLIAKVLAPCLDYMPSAEAIGD